MELSSLPSSSKVQPLVTSDPPTISAVSNPNSPNIPFTAGTLTGYPSNAGSNMGGETLSISGTNFSGGTITVKFTPTINPSSPTIALTGSLVNGVIQVLSPTPAGFGTIENYVVNVCVGTNCSSYSNTTENVAQRFYSLATLVYSDGASSPWSADINIAADANVTLINKDTTQSRVVSFWQSGGPPWVPATNIGGSGTANLSTSVELEATNGGSSNVVVLVTIGGKTPTLIGGFPDVGSNGSINVGTSGG